MLYLDELFEIGLEEADLAVTIVFGLRHVLLDEVAGADVDEDLVRILESSGDVEGGGERDEHLLAGGAEGEVVEGGGGQFEAGGGGADVVQGVVQEIDFQISLLFHCLELLHAQLLHLSSHAHAHRRRPLLHFTLTLPFLDSYFNSSHLPLILRKYLFC